MEPGQEPVVEEANDEELLALRDVVQQLSDVLRTFIFGDNFGLCLQEGSVGV